VATDEKPCPLLNQSPVHLLPKGIDISPEEYWTRPAKNGVHVSLALCRLSRMEIQRSLLDPKNPHVIRKKGLQSPVEHLTVNRFLGSKAHHLTQGMNSRVSPP